MPFTFLYKSALRLLKTGEEKRGEERREYRREERRGKEK
jgi:hypothetical protein